MPEALQLLREGRTKELWQRCCGFIDLSIDEVMAVQRRLLLEQLESLARSTLGRRVMRGAEPRTVEEFRALVPITTYDDYVPYLTERMEDTLPGKPLLWQHTAGLRCYSGEYEFKWVPVTARMYRELGDTCLAMLLFGSCRKRGDVVLEEHDKFLYGLAPPPYASGSWGRRAAEEGVFDFLPPIDEAERMRFEERIQKGFEMGLTGGIDLLMAMSSVLVAVGERLSRDLTLRNVAQMLVRRKLPARVLGAIIKSRLAGRPVLPRDLWSLKAVVSTGTDATVYRERIKRMWGRYPLSVYGSTETVILATQLWDYDAMTFLPHTNFLEFVPEDECRKWLADRTYRPEILLLDEVEEGQNYGIVITNFYGGSFVRYFLGDVVKITSLRNDRLNVDIPQMLVDSRIDGVIDVVGITRITEKTIWQAIEDSGLPYREWTVRKELGQHPRMHVYLELKAGAKTTSSQAAWAIHEQLRKLDNFYGAQAVLSEELPLEVTLLAPGSFRGYMLKQREAGADLAHLKPPHINPPDEALRFLLGPHVRDLRVEDSLETVRP